ncbi:hypothetical protein SLA2020_103630 [Shorea laevis]
MKNTKPFRFPSSPGILPLNYAFERLRCLNYFIKPKEGGIRLLLKSFSLKSKCFKYPSLSKLKTTSYTLTIKCNLC